MCKHHTGMVLNNKPAIVFHLVGVSDDLIQKMNTIFNKILKFLFSSATQIH